MQGVGRGLSARVLPRGYHENLDALTASGENTPTGSELACGLTSRLRGRPLCRPAPRAFFRAPLPHLARRASSAYAAPVHQSHLRAGAPPPDRAASSTVAGEGDLTVALIESEPSTRAAPE